MSFLSVVRKQLKNHPAEPRLPGSFLEILEGKDPDEIIAAAMNGGRQSTYDIHTGRAEVYFSKDDGLIPLFFFIGGGATMSMMYLARLALKNPDVSWDRTNNPEPWNKLEPNQQYKFFRVNMDYSKLKKDRPDF